MTFWDVAACLIIFWAFTAGLGWMDEASSLSKCMIMDRELACLFDYLMFVFFVVIRTRPSLHIPLAHQRPRRKERMGERGENHGRRSGIRYNTYTYGRYLELI